MNYFNGFLLVLFACALFFACSTTASESGGIFEFEAVGFNEVKSATSDKSAAVIDARPSVFYELGHIDGALSLPVIEFDDIFEKFNKEAGLEKFGKIIVYCSDSGCEDSLLLAKKLREKGVKNIFIYKGGWADWRNSAAKG